MNKINMPPADLLAAVREIIRYAIMTLAALKDPDKKYQGMSRIPMHVVHDLKDAYGYSSTWVRRFSPTPRDIEQMEFIAPWLSWLRRVEGEQALRRIMAWSLGSALWRVGQRENCSPDTIKNRIDRSIAAIILKFVGTSVSVERVEEPYNGVVYAAIFEKPQGPHGGEVQLKKVYVADYGFMKGGRKLRTGLERYDARKLSI